MSSLSSVRTVGEGLAGVDLTDLDALRPLADEVGPPVDAVAQPLAPDDYPSGSTCNAFDKAQVLRAW